VHHTIRSELAESALAAALMALAPRPKSPGLWINFGIALRRAGKPAEAEAAYRQALRLQPNLSIAHNNLGNILSDLNRLKEAELRRSRTASHR
jgi:Flp pilus assembly protein TadD